MKEWKKPLVKVVIIEEVLVCSTSVAGNVTGQGASKGGSMKWDTPFDNNNK